jgi:branched-chain amino acid transport system permease protein
LGLSIVLSNLALLAFGPTPHYLTVSFSERVVNVAGITLSVQRLFAFVIATLLLLATWLMLERTRLGKAVRAVAENEVVAALMSINPGRIKAITFAYSTALAGVAGALFAPLFVVTPFIGSMVGLKAFAVVIVGGFGNITGTILAALLLGVVESMATEFVPSTYRDTITFSILLLALALRPQGIVKELISESA